jgi:signal transduction histidine kinase
LHISVTQGNMPDTPLYTDWAVYNQILFQIASNAIEYNKPDGAVQVQLFFMKERHNILQVESKQRRDSVPDDQLSQQDIGKLVTVIRDTGRGIADLS